MGSSPIRIANCCDCQQCSSSRQVLAVPNGVGLEDSRRSRFVQSFALLAQWIRAPVYGTGGRRFESCTGHSLSGSACAGAAEVS